MRIEKYVIPKLDPPEVFYSGTEISRAEAKELGLVRYFTGKPCNKGHVAERHTSSAACIECTLRRHRTREYRDDMREVIQHLCETDESFVERRRKWSREWWRKNKAKV